MYSEKRCAICGNIFVPKQGRQLCCSKKCSQKKHYQNEKKRMSKKVSSMDILRNMVKDSIEYGKMQAQETRSANGL